MTTYRIEAKREIYYEVPIEANSEQEALDKLQMIEIGQDIEDYAYEWFPLDIVEITEEE